MIIWVLLLFVGTANHVACMWFGTRDIQFPPKLLQPDLEAIESYFTKIDTKIDAYLHWPNQITFLVRNYVLENKRYLNITGTFIDSSEPAHCLQQRTVYDGLYFRDDRFYLKTPNSSSMKPISKFTPVYYSQHNLPTQKNYLSIRYFGLDEIKEMIEPFGSKYKYRMNYEPQEYPPWFLAISTSTRHCIQFTLLSIGVGTWVADSALRVLIGKKLTVSENVEAERLIYDPNKRDFTIISEWPQPSEPLQNVFGVRMAKEGDLAEVKDSKVALFNSKDLWRDVPKPTHRKVQISEFLAKVRHVEPRYKHRDGAFATHSAYFHVQGHVFLKSANTVNSVDVNQNCPFVIEYETKGTYFLYETRQFEKLCTDNIDIWEKTDDGVKDLLRREKFITLTYPTE